MSREARLGRKMAWAWNRDRVRGELTHRNTTVKCATRHVRTGGALAEPEERLPWDQVFQQAFAEQQPNDADMPDFPPGATDPLPPRFAGAGGACARPDEFLDLTPDSRPGNAPGKRRRLNPAEAAAPEPQPAAPPPPGAPSPTAPSAGPAAEETVPGTVPGTEPAVPTDENNEDAMDDETFNDYLRNAFAAQPSAETRDNYRCMGFGEPDPPDPNARSSSTTPTTSTTPGTTSTPTSFGPYGPHPGQNHHDPDHDQRHDQRRDEEADDEGGDISDEELFAPRPRPRQERVTASRPAASGRTPPPAGRRPVVRSSRFEAGP